MAVDLAFVVVVVVVAEVEVVVEVSQEEDDDDDDDAPVVDGLIERPMMDSASAKDIQEDPSV